jgi:hypothetical protein
LPINVEDARGLQIQGLTPADFQAKVHGRSIKILSIALDDRPHRVVILLDASGSIASEWERVITPASALA